MRKFKNSETIIKLLREDFAYHLSNSTNNTRSGEKSYGWLEDFAKNLIEYFENN